MAIIKLRFASLCGQMTHCILKESIYVVKGIINCFVLLKIKWSAKNIRQINHKFSRYKITV